MHTGLRITAFAAALAATFGTAYGVGQAVDPVVSDTAAPAHDDHDRRSPAPKEHAGHGDATPGGLQISEDGYTLDLATPRVTAGQRGELRFTVRDDTGRAVTDYRREHGKELHLILASRDLVTYRHLHPTRAADGSWSTPVDLPARATTASSPTSRPSGRAPGTSPSARTSPPAGATNPPGCRRRPVRPGSTATGSTCQAPCARAGRPNSP